MNLHFQIKKDTGYDRTFKIFVELFNVDVSMVVMVEINHNVVCDICLHKP